MALAPTVTARTVLLLGTLDTKGDEYGYVLRIKRDLVQRLQADGFRSVAEAVGAD